ncbi:DUF3313 domain-containing protein [Pseudomonas sp. N040]|uniref:DUF3313 domain-containing protein n=1 Tax=Pseudomonas sp. N040 TaxID=2785325 RepID=UPI0018A30C05|nr:DUF3313 domain-containing protein [Pseudomonas sp. N040]MBF7729077.1 DUF3313 domain-containing protein [Pseudomonas sp. N040]MBW7012717.1 DUF3313 domain-containing protein [Pseudomonas sp. N040]
MNMSRQWLTGIALGSLLLTGCTSMVTEKSQYSGFLPNYDGLEEVTTPSGATAMRWVAEGFQPSAYNTVVFKGLQQYPAPKPNERVNTQTLQELQAYTDSNVKSTLAQKYKVVSSLQAAPAGSRTLVLNAAMTGVSASNEGMKWYNVIPVSAVISGVQVATGTRDQDTELYIEADIIDAASGKPVAKVVRKVFGKQLDNDSQEITADDFKEAIKGMTDDMAVMLK